MGVEFKAPIPKADSPHHCPRTLAIYNTGKFIDDPLMRHESYVELWTAPPTEVHGKGMHNPVLTSEWRQHQRCLAVSYHTTIILGTRDLGNRKEKAKPKDAAAASKL